MLVKKIDSEWMPSEKPDLKVGENIEITNPKELILQGKAVAVTEEGIEISAYDLYGVITRDERKDFEDYLKVKKQQDLGKQLKKENEELELKKTTTEVIVPKVVEPLSYQELLKKAQEKGVWKVGMSKLQLEELVLDK